MNINKFKSFYNYFFNKIKSIIHIDNNSKDSISSSEVKTLYRKSSSNFPKIDEDNRVLKYEYYDVPVKGIEYRDVDLSKIQLEHFVKFEFEETNQYDNNAIKILYNDISIGYIPKNNLQEMMKSYSNGKTRQVCGFISSVNEITKEITLGLGFYSK